MPETQCDKATKDLARSANDLKNSVEGRDSNRRIDSRRNAFINTFERVEQVCGKNDDNFYKIQGILLEVIGFLN